jgi:hypothetical protein
LPEIDGDQPKKKRFASYTIGGSCPRARPGGPHRRRRGAYRGGPPLFVAVDRTSTFAFAEVHERATRRAGADFLHASVAAVPYRIPTVLTDDGTRFVDRTPANQAHEAAAAACWAARSELRVWLVHAFDHAWRTAWDRAPYHPASPPPPQAPARGPCRKRIDGPLTIDGRTGRGSG